MSTFTYKTLTALALTGALLAAPAFAEEAHHSQGAATPPATAGQGLLPHGRHSLCQTAGPGP